MKSNGPNHFVICITNVSSLLFVLVSRVCQLLFLYLHSSDEVGGGLQPVCAGPPSPAAVQRPHEHRGN